MTMEVHIVASDSHAPKEKLADAEIHFTYGPLEGLKLIGFAIWRQKSGYGLNISFPARQYAVEGKKRNFALLRPMDENDVASQDNLRRLILKAYTEFEELGLDKMGKENGGSWPTSVSEVSAEAES